MPYSFSPDEDVDTIYLFIVLDFIYTLSYNYLLPLHLSTINIFARTHAHHCVDVFTHAWTCMDWEGPLIEDAHVSCESYINSASP